MKISEMKDLLSARMLTGAQRADEEAATAYAGDMLSDVLALGTAPDVLLTGLVNPQVIRTAEMLDTLCVVFLRNKEPGEDILALAERSGVCVLATSLEMYAACAALSRGGVAAAQ